VLGFGAHLFQVGPALVVQPLAIVFQKRQGPAVDTAQGRPQVVGNRITERLQFPVGRHQLGGAFPDAPFQGAVEGADFCFRLLAGRVGAVQVLGDGAPAAVTAKTMTPAEPRANKAAVRAGLENWPGMIWFSHPWARTMTRSEAKRSGAAWPGPRSPLSSARASPPGPPPP